MGKYTYNAETTWKDFLFNFQYNQDNSDLKEKLPSWMLLCNTLFQGTCWWLYT